jgi:hypothetical protein
LNYKVCHGYPFFANEPWRTSLLSFMNLMVKFISLLLLFGVQAGMAQDAKLQLSLSGGYGQENLQWSIAGNANGQHPNILSALHWKNVSGPVTNLHLQYRFFDRWQLEGEYGHMFILSGKVSDTDYGSDNRTNVVYAAQFNSDKGGADRWLAGLAYQLPVTHTFSITPAAGYGQFHQSLYITGYPDLNSTYKTTWTGPYGQVLCAMELTKKLEMNAGLRYDQVQYRASANWNLIRTFTHPESFRHTANGYGLNAHASVLYHISKLYSIGIKGSYSRWQTGRGIDELYLATGESQQTQLNEVQSSGWQLMVEWRVALF